jgi:ABC-type glutathione transport system ATPase component
MALLELKSVTLSLGGPPVLDAVDLRVEKGERVCLLGRNGEGKTTLLRLLAGEVRPDDGEIIRPAALRVGMLPQEVPTDMAGTVRQVVLGGLAALPGAGEAAEAWRTEHLADQILTRSGLDGDADFAALSAGSKRRALLARALVGEPDILLLDEPTTWTSTPSSGSRTSCAASPAPCSSSPTTAPSCADWPSASSSWTAAACATGPAITQPSCAGAKKCCAPSRPSGPSSIASWPRKRCGSARACASAAPATRAACASC